MSGRRGHAGTITYLIESFDMRALRRLAPYLKPHTRRFVQACLIMFAVAGLNGATVYVVGPAVNQLFEKTDPRKLLLVVLAIPVIFFLKLVVTYTQGYLMSWLSQK